MEIAFSTLIVFFDCILLVSLYRNYKRLNHTYLALGAIAVSIEIMRQIISHSGLYLDDSNVIRQLSGLLRMLVALSLLLVAFQLTGRRVPVRTSLLALLVYLIDAAYIASVDSLELYHWIIVTLPITAVNVVAGILLLLSREADRTGFKWLAGSVLTIGAIQLGMPFTLDTPGPGLLLFFEAMGIVLIAATLIVRCYEGVYRSLLTENERLHQAQRDREALEKNFQQAQKLESLGVMASGIAHDFNNLLTSILGYASLAVTKLKADDPVREDVYMVISGARQAVELTSQMLTYAGKKPVEFELLDINDVVDGFSELSKSRMPGKVDLELNLQRNLPLLSGDSVQLGQVLMILLSNAATAIGHEKGRIEVSTGTKDTSAEFQKECLFAENAAVGTHLYLRVDDTGVGIKKNQLDLIFDPFYSGKSTGKGLGLASLSGIVRQHHGFVHVNSELGVGSQFSVFFPIVSYQKKALRSEKVAHPFTDQKFKARILVAEEDNRIRGLIKTVMEKVGHEVIATATGQETLDLMSEDTTGFDLLLLDFTMPKVSGSEVYRDIRIRFPTLPVIFTSGYAQDQVVEEMLDDPYASFLSKPFTISDLATKVSSMLPEASRKDRLAD